MIFFVYCLLAISWSDFPLVAFKRWIKVLGHPIMALIVLTEPDPGEALTRLMKRCAYVIVPVSILFIKYYPEWGRGFDFWTGAAFNTGITTNKNCAGRRLLDPWSLFLLESTTNLATRAGQPKTKRTIYYRWVSVSDLVAFLDGTLFDFARFVARWHLIVIASRATIRGKEINRHISNCRGSRLALLNRYLVFTRTCFTFLEKRPTLTDRT